MELRIIEADYDKDQHARDIIYLTDQYSQDPMGMDEPLPNSTRIHLIEGLKEISTAFTLLAYREGDPVGIANCFIGFSTFQAQKLVNIHDIAVVEEMRGRGIGEQLLEAVQKKARELDCCRITLEVRDDNPARKLYERFGFINEDPRMWFMTKELY